MKKTIFALLCLIIALMLCSCCLSHEWADATCEAPMTCTKCGKTEGEALGHTWQDANCVTPKTCTVCSATEGEPLGHTFADATCEAPMTCTMCSVTEGDALGHTWADATCEAPMTCTKCGKTEGEVADHCFGDWVELDAETEESTCTACGHVEQRAIDRQAKLMEYLEGNWNLCGFYIGDAYYGLSQITNADEFDCSLYFGSDGSVQLAYTSGDTLTYATDFSELSYSKEDGFDMYIFYLDDGYSYATFLYVYPEGSVMLGSLLDQDVWIFTQ